MRRRVRSELTKILVVVFKSLGLGLIRYSHLNELQKSRQGIDDLNFLREMEGGFNLNPIVANLDKSQSQLGQDLFVLSVLDFKTSGFFVEFGATNGKELSNSYILEREFDWDGILSEPARVWHGSLKKNRRAEIDTRCVWSKSDENIEFTEAADGVLSTVSKFKGSDTHAKSRKSGKTYLVETVSLEDLLLQRNAPKEIDYLSIDTEGSEYEILSAFDFNKYDIKVITVEHNFTKMREPMRMLLENNGFTRVLTRLSIFDDWYVSKDLVPKFR